MSQFYIFLLCTAAGIAAGPLYDLLYCLKRLVRKRWLDISCDILFCLALGGGYLLTAVRMGFPSLRFFHVLGLLTGLLLYLKSFHKIVAFFSDKVYNRDKRLKEEGSRWTKEKLKETK